ncbi:SUKH-4 family immunity protein [Kitasatospora sp. NPDC057223]|uniref:SUKH-4 family immunity protein n=1 Tax=Kitasatospora sp. NPDC057223 TaxID=3346055 RepID=UPI0036414BE5
MKFDVEAGDLLRDFGPAGVCRARREALQGLPVQESSREFLTSVGIPAAGLFSISGALADRESGVAGDAVSGESDIVVVDVPEGRLLRIGWIQDFDVLVHLENGRVYFGIGDGHVLVHDDVSSLSSLLRLIGQEFPEESEFGDDDEFGDDGDDGDDDDDEAEIDRPAAARRIRSAITAGDPLPLSAPGSPWPAILDDYETGIY